MSNETMAPRNPFADIAPALADYTVRVLFGDVWKRSGLSPRDRSLITGISRLGLSRYRTPVPPEARAGEWRHPRPVGGGNYTFDLLCRVARGEHGPTDLETCS